MSTYTDPDGHVWQHNEQRAEYTRTNRDAQHPRTCEIAGEPGLDLPFFLEVAITSNADGTRSVIFDSSFETLDAATHAAHIFAR